MEVRLLGQISWWATLVAGCLLGLSCKKATLRRQREKVCLWVESSRGRAYR